MFLCTRDCYQTKGNDVSTPKELLVKLNLVGLDGNAFFLMGAYKRAASRQKIDSTYVDKVIKTCMSGDYDHLLRTLIANTYTEEIDDEY